MGKGNIKVILASDNEKVVWDKYVKEQKDATPYHLYAWKQVAESSYGQKGYYLIAINNAAKGTVQKVLGILPLVHLKIPFGKGVLISLPFCDTAGPLSDNKEIEESLIAETLSLAKKIKVNEIEIRSSKSESYFRFDPFYTEINSHKVRMFLDLPNSSEKLLKCFKSKLRSQIKKPEKEGLHFEWGGINKLDDFYQVLSFNMKMLGSPVHSRMWFKSILEYYEDKVRMGLVYKGQQPVGCGILLLFNDTVTVPWASTLRKYNYLSPNMMLYWNFLAFASDRGYTDFDFGRSSPGESTYNFKSQWGAQPEALYWYKISMKKKKTLMRSTDSEKLNSNREIAAYLWRKLPLCVANSLGSRIRKYISL